MTRKTFVVVVFLFAVCAGLRRTSAQGGPTPRPVTDSDVNRVASTLYCPVCQNVPLEVCDTQACEQWRQEIRGLLAQGFTDDRIRDRFVQEYGQKTVGLPTVGTTFALTVYLPYVLTALIGVVIAVMLVSWRRRASLTSAVGTPSDAAESSRESSEEYRKRLEEEIRRLE